jgi:hypothetical protein
MKLDDVGERVVSPESAFLKLIRGDLFFNIPIAKVGPLLNEVYFLFIAFMTTFVPCITSNVSIMPLFFELLKTQ